MLGRGMKVLRELGAFWKVWTMAAACVRVRLGGSLALPGALCCVVAAGLGSAADAETIVIDFEELQLVEVEYYEKEPFVSHEATFNNNYFHLSDYCCSEGWAYSRLTDSTSPGFENQYSAFPGGGAGGSAQYAVAFDGFDAGNDDGLIPAITLPDDAEPVSVQVTNTTYAALTTRDGDGYNHARAFGGEDGDEPDWFKLRIEGWRDEATFVTDVEFFLADYRPTDNTQDYIVDDWQRVDLSSMQGLGVTILKWRLDSTVSNSIGLLTPAYVAIDDLTLEIAVLEGDFNGDGQVDASDLELWETDFGVDYDGSDFLAWQRGYSNAASAASVAEPASFLLTVLSLFACALTRLRINRQRRSPLTS